MSTRTNSRQHQNATAEPLADGAGQIGVGPRQSAAKIQLKRQLQTMSYSEQIAFLKPEPSPPASSARDVGKAVQLTAEPNSEQSEGGDSTGPATGITHEQVIEQLRADGNTIRSMLSAMKDSGDELYRNSVLYCERKTDSGYRVAIHPVAPAHDSDQRVADPANERAWVVGESYDESSDNVHTMSRTIGGLSTIGTIGIIVTRDHGPPREVQSEKVRMDAFVHEVQHRADFADIIDFDGLEPELDDCWTSFRSEFQAFWIMRFYSRCSCEDQAAPLSRDVNPEDGSAPVTVFATNERALEVKSRILRRHSYQSVLNAYRDDPSFKRELDDYNHPEGANLENEPNVDAFMLELLEGGPRIALFWAALSEEQRARFRDPNQLRPNVLDLLDQNYSWFIPALGLIDGELDEADWPATATLCQAIQSEDSEQIDSAIAGLSERARGYLRDHPEFAEEYPDIQFPPTSE